jgi:hypothetical protein
MTVTPTIPQSAARRWVLTPSKKWFARAAPYASDSNFPSGAHVVAPGREFAGTHVLIDAAPRPLDGPAGRKARSHVGALCKIKGDVFSAYVDWAMTIRARRAFVFADPEGGAKTAGAKGREADGEILGMCVVREFVYSASPTGASFTLTPLEPWTDKHTGPKSFTMRSDPERLLRAMPRAASRIEPLLRPGDRVAYVDLICSDARVGRQLMNGVEDFYMHKMGFDATALSALSEVYGFYARLGYAAHDPVSGLTLQQLANTTGPTKLFDARDSEGYLLIRRLSPLGAAAGAGTGAAAGVTAATRRGSKRPSDAQQQKGPRAGPPSPPLRPPRAPQTRRSARRTPAAR